MNAPTNDQFLLATAWMDHFGSTWAWEDLDELVHEAPEAAWHLILVMVAYAPDYGTLAAIAAGPVEDFVVAHGAAYSAHLLQEASTNARFRACLRATYLDLQPEIRQLVEENASAVFPPSDSNVQPSTEELRLMIAWFHHHDTHDATSRVDALIKSDSAGSLAVLCILLLLSDEKRDLRDDVLLFAIEPFIRNHLGTHRDTLKGLARQHDYLREWITTQKRSPIADEVAWQTFARDLEDA